MTRGQAVGREGVRGPGVDNAVTCRPMCPCRLLDPGTQRGQATNAVETGVTRGQAAGRAGVRGPGVDNDVTCRPLCPCRLLDPGAQRVQGMKGAFNALILFVVREKRNKTKRN